MNKKKPVVEIMMATYNGESYLGEQIESILAQTETAWRLTISDDQSTDGTLEMIDAYVRQNPDRIARHESGRRFGNARDHFFYLMKMCKAQYVFFCDQDDVWYPQKIGKMMNAMEKAEAEHGAQVPVLVFSDQIPTDAQLTPLAPSLTRYQKHYVEQFDYRSLLMQNVVTGGAMMANRALIRKALQCAAPQKTIMHDWWMAVTAARFGQVVYLDEPLGAYRQHGTNSVGAKDVESISYAGRMMLQLGDVKRRISDKKRQAAIFAQTYGLGDDEKEQFFEGFCKERSGAWFYWKNRDLIHGMYRLIGMMVLG